MLLMFYQLQKLFQVLFEMLALFVKALDGLGAEYRKEHLASSYIEIRQVFTKKEPFYL